MTKLTTCAPTPQQSAIDEQWSVRVKALEEENGTLRAELATSKSEIASALKAVQSAQTKVTEERQGAEQAKAVVEAKVLTLEAGANEGTIERAKLTTEVSALRRERDSLVTTIEAMKADGNRKTDKICELTGQAPHTCH